jgi:hypothetical protein
MDYSRCLVECLSTMQPGDTQATDGLFSLTEEHEVTTRGNSIRETTIVTVANAAKYANFI